MVGCEILKSRFAVTQRRTHTSVFLRQLGIQFRRGQGFWLRNEADLDFIFEEFKRRSREVKSELHPDAGGDATEFKAFGAACGVVERAFAARGIGVTPISTACAKEATALRRGARLAAYLASPLGRERGRRNRSTYYWKHRETILAKLCQKQKASS